MIFLSRAAHSKNDPTQNEYQLMMAKQTLKTGKFYSSIAIPVILSMAIIETNTYQNFYYLLFRSLLIIPSAIFCFFSISIFKKNSNLIIPFHLLNLTGTILMMLGLVFIRLIHFPMYYIISTVSSGMVSVIFIIYLVAAACRKYLSFLIIPAILITFIAFYQTHHFSWTDLSLFINPFFAGLGACFFGLKSEKAAYRDFLLKRELENAKSELEIEITERKIMEEQLKYQASRDELTNLYNRRKAFSILRKQLTLSIHGHQNLTVCFIDVDKLKLINDTMGHAEGDLLLKNVALMLKDNIRVTDFICRIGGDEFLVIFPNCTTEEAEIIVNRVREKLNFDYHTDFSYGCAEYNETSKLSVRELVELADNNMYRQKLLKNKNQKKRPALRNTDQHTLF